MTAEALPERVWTTGGPGIPGFVIASADLRPATAASAGTPFATVKLVLGLSGPGVSTFVCFQSHKWPGLHVRVAQASGDTVEAALRALRRASPLPDGIEGIGGWNLAEAGRTATHVLSALAARSAQPGASEDTAPQHLREAA
jgi:hypothetical protein